MSIARTRRWAFLPRLFVVAVLLSGAILADQATCFATNVSLQWNANTETNIAGYKVYYQADSSVQPFKGTGATEGAAPVNVGNKTTATLSNLDPARTWYFAITAFNTAGLESAYSSVVKLSELVPPTASVTYPANGATATGTVSVTASASDNVGVTKVEFYVNGVLQATDTSTPYLYSWNTGLLAAGTYTLMVKAYDAAGNVGQSSTVSVSVVKDATAPTVAITAPANNASVSGTVAITVSASDNIGVSKVEFYDKGVLLSASNVAPYSYNWNTASVAGGSHILTAKAYDAAGNVGQSSGVTVNVTPTATTSDTTAPTVSITAPGNGASVSGTATVTASATDNVGVSRVEFYVSGALRATDTASPFAYSWNTTSVANGSYVLTAKAYDAAGNSRLSGTTTVTVNNTTTAASFYTIWPATTVPSVVDSSDSNAVELGLKFRADSSGYITGIRFYKASTNTGTHIGNLWTSSGTRLATATFTNETASGWQQVLFSSPVAITANTVYVASYYTSTGHYSSTLNYFATLGKDSPPLHALATGVSGANGVYRYGSASGFPSQSWASTNYWVDVMFTPGTSASDVTVPTVTAFTIPSTATALTVPVSSFIATDNTGVTGYRITESATAPSATTTGWSTTIPTSYAFATAGTKTLYAWAKDAAGNVSATRSASVSITLAAPTSTSSIWWPGAVPAVVAASDTNAVELGLKFRSDSSGYITGIRFYKASTNTGTHTGTLWTSTGTRLATATFTNETASGWQQVNFATPIAVTANTVYVASYHTNVGRYSVNQNYFATLGVDTPPLHALASGVSGSNGVYAYGTTSIFPTQSYLSSNYWVDVVFRQ